jgi:hypothetical protein
VLTYFFPLQGLFINLGTTFIGILLTVFYVDWILGEHEKKRWAQVQHRIDERITRFANHAVSEFRSAFRYGTEILNTSVFGSADPKPARAEIARIAENILIPSAPTKIEGMNQSDWKRLSANLSLLVQTADQLIALYGDKLDPNIFSLIVEIQEKANGILSNYSVFPDIFGVPDEQLPVPSKGSAIEHKRYLNKSAANEAQELLTHAASLLRKLSKVAL